MAWFSEETETATVGLVVTWTTSCSSVSGSSSWLLWGTTLIWVLARLSSYLVGVVTAYDRRIPACFSFTLASFKSSLVWSLMIYLCLGFGPGSCLADLKGCLLIFRVGLPWIVKLRSSSVGDGSLWSIGLGLRHSKAMSGSSLMIFALSRTAWTGWFYLALNETLRRRYG